jgi:uncharacterized protein YqjF (DUF2071 family)
MFQRWEKLLFLHWKLDPQKIQETLPKGLTVDTFDGSAWLGVVPFFMRGVRPAWLPAVPWLSNFQELNVRTYVHTADGTPGVWFYSLDCNQPVAVWAARTFFHLPYFDAKMDWTMLGDSDLSYGSIRKGDETGRRAGFVYKDISLSSGLETRKAEAGSLEFFLLERYLLFSQRQDGSLRSGQVAHEPYRFRPSSPEKWSACPAELDGFQLDGRGPDHSCLAEDVAVKIFGLQQLRTP